MAIRPPKFDPAALISSIQMHGMPIAPRSRSLSRPRLSLAQRRHDAAIARRRLAADRAARPGGHQGRAASRSAQGLSPGVLLV